MSPSSISVVESGKVAVSKRLLKKLEERFYVSPIWLEHGIGEMFMNPAGMVMSDERVEPSANITVTHDAPTGFTKVRRLDVSVSAGHGAINYEPDEIEGVYFSDQWLDGIGITSSSCALLLVKGDSMSPTMQDGALVLVDFTSAVFETGQIFALAFGDEVMVKRVEIGDAGTGRNGLSLVLVSDNRYYPPRSLSNHDAVQVRCIGRVRAVINPL